MKLVFSVTVVFFSGIILLASCTKNSNADNPPAITQPRATNAFGQSLPQNVACRITKFYGNSPDTATYLYYDANGLLIKTEEKEKTTLADQTVFVYDNVNRITKIVQDNGTVEYVFDYGSSATKVQKIITNYTLNSSRHDTAFISYPNPNKIVFSITDRSINDFRRDTLEFDNNNNLIKQIEYSGPSGSNLALSLRRTTSFNTAVKSFSYGSALGDLLIMFSATEWDAFPPGNNLVFESFYYDYSASPSLADHITIQDIQVNANGYPVFFKVKDISSNIISPSHLEYDCN